MCYYAQTKWRCSTIFLTRNLIIKDCRPLLYWARERLPHHCASCFWFCTLSILIDLLTGLCPHAHDFVTDKWSALIDKLFSISLPIRFSPFAFWPFCNVHSMYDANYMQQLVFNQLMGLSNIFTLFVSLCISFEEEEKRETNEGEYSWWLLLEYVCLLMSFVVVFFRILQYVVRQCDNMMYENKWNRWQLATIIALLDCIIKRELSGVYPFLFC